jgi:putative DNA primase/helicase
VGCQARKMAPPETRPLYNQPGLAVAAQSSWSRARSARRPDRFGMVATTAMHGANAPVDKTDWSPLAGKAVLIWPDRTSRAGNTPTAPRRRSCWLVRSPATSCTRPRTNRRGLGCGRCHRRRLRCRGLPGHGPRLQMHRCRTTPSDPPAGGGARTGVGHRGRAGAGFTRRYHRDWRYVAGVGRWLVWDGLRWRTEDTLAATDLIRSVCRHAARCNATTPRSPPNCQLQHGRRCGTAGAGRPQARGHHRRMGCRSVAAQHPRWRGRSQDRTQAPARPRRPDDQDHHGHAAGGDCPTGGSSSMRSPVATSELQAYLQRMVGYA